MTTTAIRKKLIIYLAHAEDKKVKAIYPLFEDEIKQADVFKLTDEHIKILGERRERHVSEKDKSSGWQEAHNTIRKKRKPRGV